MKNYKFRVRDEKHSEEIQEYLFSKGCRWSRGSARVKLTEKPFLYVTNNEIMYGSSGIFFNNDMNQKITLEKLKAMETLSEGFIKKNPNKTLKELFPYLFELEIGKWYKNPINSYGRGLYYLTEVTENPNNPHMSYGVTTSGIWTDEYERNLYNCVLADAKEVGEALIKEAKRRGFKNISNISIMSLYGSNFNSGYFSYNGSEYNYNLNKNCLDLDGVEIFKSGKWAEIIEEKTYKVGDRILIDGYEYMISKGNQKKVSLIHLKSGYSWDYGFKVNDINKITEQELDDHICAPCTPCEKD